VTAIVLCLVVTATASAECGKECRLANVPSAADIVRKPGKRVYDYIWVWGNPEQAAHTGDVGKFGAADPISRVNMLGAANVFMAGAGVPLDPAEAEKDLAPVAHLDRIVYEIAPDKKGTFDYTKKLETIATMAGKHGNIQGLLLDDMSTVKRSKGFLPEHLEKVRAGVPTAPDGWRLKLLGVIYTMSLKDKGIEKYIEPLDGVNLWTWAAEDTAELEANVQFVRKIAPKKPIILGLYLTNYGGKQPMTVEVMQKQSDSALAMLKAGEICGIVMLLHGQENPKVVEWTRDWIKRVGDQPMPK